MEDFNYSISKRDYVTFVGLYHGVSDNQHLVIRPIFAPGQLTLRKQLEQFTSVILVYQSL